MCVRIIVQFLSWIFVFFVPDGSRTIMVQGLFVCRKCFARVFQCFNFCPSIRPGRFPDRSRTGQKSGQKFQKTLDSNSGRARPHFHSIGCFVAQDESVISADTNQHQLKSPMRVALEAWSRLPHALTLHPHKRHLFCIVL